MRGAAFALVLLALTGCAAGPRLTPAAPAQGGAILAGTDDYLAVLTPADLSLRLALPTGATLAALQTRYAGGTLAWSADDIRRLGRLEQRNKASLKALRHWLPSQILLIRASPAIEGGLPHTRGAAISLGPALPGSDVDLDRLFFHELFHVLSRHNPDRRDELYRIIGFEPCATLDLPAALTDARITNPDAVTTRHVVPVDGLEPVRWLLPWLSARPARFDPAIGDRFTAYFTVSFLAVRRGGDGACALEPAPDGVTRLDFAAVRAALFARTGANTDYVIHPEETLADNFADLMTGRRAVPDPQVQDRLAAFLGVRRPPPAPQRRP